VRRDSERRKIAHGRFKAGSEVAGWHHAHHPQGCGLLGEWHHAGYRAGVSDGDHLDDAGIPEDRYPIRCAHCGQELPGLGPRGRCPACGTEFDRAQSLWDTYGPEAFANPPLTAEEQADGTIASPLIAGLLFALVLIVALPIGWAMWLLLFGAFDYRGGLVTWLVIAAILEWLLVVRLRERRRSSSNEQGDRTGDDGGSPD